MLLGMALSKFLLFIFTQTLQLLPCRLLFLFLLLLAKNAQKKRSLFVFYLTKLPLVKLQSGIACSYLGTVLFCFLFLSHYPSSVVIQFKIS